MYETLVVSKTCPIMYNIFRSTIQAVEVAKSSNKVMFRPPICRQDPQISDIGLHFQIALTFEHVVGFG